MEMICSVLLAMWDLIQECKKKKSSWPFYYMHAKKNEIVTVGPLQSI